MDGWRMVAYKDAGRLRLIGRSGTNHTARFTELAQAITQLPARSLILDGEVAIFDEHLISRFDLLWERRSEQNATPPMFMAFDCLYVNGRDLRERPLRERREILEAEIDDQRMVLPVRRLAEDGREAWDEVKRRRYEGLVAKDESAGYRPSTRWLKVKLREEGRFVVGGLAMAGAGHQGGLLVGEREGDQLLYRGFIDLGLSRAALEALRTDAHMLVRTTSPFADLKRRRETIWLEPEIEVEVS